MYIADSKSENGQRQFSETFDIISSDPPLPPLYTVGVTTLSNLFPYLSNKDGHIIVLLTEVLVSDNLIHRIWIT